VDIGKTGHKFIKKQRPQSTPEVPTVQHSSQAAVEKPRQFILFHFLYSRTDLSFVQVCRGYGDLHGDPHGYGVGMGIEIPSPRPPCISSIVAPCGLWCCTNRPSLFPGQRSYYFPSAAVGVDSSHMTASSSASWSRFSPSSNFVNGHALTVWFITCHWPQSQGDWLSSSMCKLHDIGLDLSGNGLSETTFDEGDQNREVI